LPVGGVGFETTEGDRDVVRGLFIFLEDRHILSIEPHDDVGPDHIVDSVREVREELVDSAKRLTAKSVAAEPILRMREVCAEYLHWRAASSREALFIGIGRIQGVFAAEVRRLARLYDLEMPRRLTRDLEKTKLDYFEQRGAVRYPSGRELDPSSGGNGRASEPGALDGRPPEAIAASAMPIEEAHQTVTPDSAEAPSGS
jgi:hypothetical protein